MGKFKYEGSFFEYNAETEMFPDDKQFEVIVYFINKERKQIKEMQELLIAAKDEMLECNKDSGANYYFDSCNEIIEYLKDNILE